MERLRLPLTMVIAVCGFAATSGGTLAVANSRQAHTDERVEGNSRRIDALEKEIQSARERLLRIEVVTEQTNKVVERIDRKLGQ